jgi:uncharacterized protein YlxW (UPF0749 family)
VKERVAVRWRARAMWRMELNLMKERLRRELKKEKVRLRRELKLMGMEMLKNKAMNLRNQRIGLSPTNPVKLERSKKELRLDADGAVLEAEEERMAAAEEDIAGVGVEVLLHRPRRSAVEGEAEDVAGE